MPAQDMTITATWESYLDMIEAMNNFEGDNLAIARGYYVRLNDDQLASESEKLAALKAAIKADAENKLRNHISGKVNTANDLLNINEVGQIAKLIVTDGTVDIVLIKGDYQAVQLTNITFLEALFGGMMDLQVTVVGSDNIPYKAGMSQNAIMAAVANAAGVGLDLTAALSILDGKDVQVILSGTTAEGIDYSVEYAFSFFNEKHNVTWDTDGGTITVPGTEGMTESGAAITAPTVEKTGYTFAGWDNDVPETMGRENLSFKALWTANTYTVKFDANGGSGTMADQSFTYDAAQALTANSFTKTGYTFAGWKLGETVYADGASVSNLTADANGEVTLVAQWTANINNLIYVVDGAQTSSTLTAFGTEVTVKADLSKTGYSFSGWSVSGATPVSGKFTMPDNDVTVSGSFTANKYMVYFNAGEGSCETVSKEVTYDGTYGALPTPTREGYTFKGWYVGGTQIKAEDTVRITEDT